MHCRKYTESVHRMASFLNVRFRTTGLQPPQMNWLRGLVESKVAMMGAATLLALLSPRFVLAAILFEYLHPACRNA